MEDLWEGFPASWSKKYFKRATLEPLDKLPVTNEPVPEASLFLLTIQTENPSLTYRFLCQPEHLDDLEELLA